MLGVREGEVRLVEHDPAWAGCFRRERLRLRRALGPRLLAVEHIGSTAVPGLPAKPIIDLAIRVRRFRNLPSLIHLLAALGYRHQGEHGLPGRQFFVRGDPVTHHLHVVAARSPHWAVWLALRDRLRADPAARARYAAGKRRLARRFAHRRADYTRGKTPLVQALLKPAAPAG